jgi:hypothetical protein
VIRTEQETGAGACLGQLRQRHGRGALPRPLLLGWAAQGRACCQGADGRDLSRPYAGSAGPHWLMCSAAWFNSAGLAVPAAGCNLRWLPCATRCIACAAADARRRRSECRCCR